MTIFEIIIWHLIVKVCGQSPTYQCVFLCTACSIIISNYVKFWFDVQSKQSMCQIFVQKKLLWSENGSFFLHHGRPTSCSSRPATIWIGCQLQLQLGHKIEENVKICKVILRTFDQAVDFYLASNVWEKT